MYYEAKDPVVLVGEKREAPKVVTMPVNETTPQFKNFYVNNIVCDGASKAVFIRGIPEMHIKNIELKNMIIKASKGIDISEASNISFKNVEVIPDNTDPVADILNSNNVSFDKLVYPQSSETLFRIGGDRADNISVTNTNTSLAKQKTVFEFGAGEKNLKIK